MVDGRFSYGLDAGTIVPEWRNLYRQQRATYVPIPRHGGWLSYLSFFVEIRLPPWQGKLKYEQETWYPCVLNGEIPTLMRLK
jgi:hypothetical protein